MKTLLIEVRRADEGISFIAEEKEGKKNYFIEGTFMQAEVKNRNGRLYPAKILEKEVTRYNKEYVADNRAVGELSHPNSVAANYDRVSHKILSLKMEGNDVFGRAKIIDTPCGKIVKTLLDENVKIGVSSRGLGSLKDVDGVNVVQEDFVLATVDIVSDPSAPDAFVSAIMEGKQWVWENGVLKEADIAKMKADIERATPRNREKVMIEAFSGFMSKLRKI